MTDHLKFNSWNLLIRPMKLTILFHVFDKRSHGALLISYRSLYLINKEIYSLLNDASIWRWISEYWEIEAAIEKPELFFSSLLTRVSKNEFFQEEINGLSFNAEEIFIDHLFLPANFRRIDTFRVRKGVILIGFQDEKRILFFLEIKNRLIIDNKKFLIDKEDIAFGWHGVYIKNEKGKWIFRLWENFFSSDSSKDLPMTFRARRSSYPHTIKWSHPTIFGADLLIYNPLLSNTWYSILFHPLDNEIYWYGNIIINYVISGCYLYENKWVIYDIITGEKLASDVKKFKRMKNGRHMIM